MNWYPQKAEELNRVLKSFLKNPEIDVMEVHGIIVPHAGYEFSGKIAGKAFALLPKKEKAIVISPSHYAAFHGLMSLEKIETPLGEMKITENDYKKLTYEHAIDNQIPFLQKLGYSEVLPLVVGGISENEAEKIAEELSNESSPIIISTDLSHFLPYNIAVKKDRETIKIIEELDLSRCREIDACGIFPVMIAMNLCKQKGWRPHLIEYKNSRDVIGDGDGVVGYASFWF